MSNIKIYAKNLEGSAQNQVYTLGKTKAFEGAKIRIMPDAHAGAGCVIGFTANLGDKVVPNLVGVDEGCGMYAVKWQYNGNRTIYMGGNMLAELDEVIHRVVPSGFSVHDHAITDTASLGLRCAKHLINIERLGKSMGTLGGGNHFIEIDKDEETGEHWLVIHTGSRNLGLQVATIYQKIAEETCTDKVPHGLEYLQGQYAEDYLHDAQICQQWAAANRTAIAAAVLGEMGADRIFETDSFQTVHNYIGDDGIVRKGAISAREGERVLIPFNMRDGSVIGIGKGNEDWNFSAPHGAGRAMSRSQAKCELSLDEFVEQMDGIYSTTVQNGTLDEAPGAYKPAAEILALLEPTVEIKSRLKPVYNFKSVNNKRKKDVK